MSESDVHTKRMFSFSSMEALRHLSSTSLRAPRCLVIYVQLPITSHIMIEIGRQRLPRLAEWSLAGYTVPRDRDNKGR